MFEKILDYEQAEAAQYCYEYHVFDLRGNGLGRDCRWWLVSVCFDPDNSPRDRKITQFAVIITGIEFLY